jgi:hypothetical protein
MPSRLTVFIIVTAWLAITGYVIHRDVWPRYFGDAPPPLQIDLADEATQLAPTRWTIYRGETAMGTLTTRMQYQAEDDTFRFTNSYAKLAFDLGQGKTLGLTLEIPRLETTIRVSRTGDLREQTMSGELKAKMGPLELGQAGAEVRGKVVGGQLLGRCLVRYPLSSVNPTIDRELEPVAVPAGQVLNPMMPLNRLRDITPGKRWVIREVDPLKDAINTLLREMLKDSKVNIAAMPASSGQELIAEVLSDIETYTPKLGPPVPCRIIEYRGEASCGKKPPASARNCDLTAKIEAL